MEKIFKSLWGYILVLGALIVAFFIIDGDDGQEKKLKTEDKDLIKDYEKLKAEQRSIKRKIAQGRLKVSDAAERIRAVKAKKKIMEKKIKEMNANEKADHLNNKLGGNG